ncbi:MAG TPA: glycosyltransferase family 2 protein [Solirubrobacterales bacterium]|nr:glycosyltransferase family 2 protein [Solirubrobacterales bacterium]
MTLLSVVTPVRNQARYLGETLDSVAALTVPHEHIVVDGASDDGTVELLRSRSDENLSWTSEPDEGQTDAVNKGFARARGDLLAWVNGDDAYVPDAVDRAVAYLDAHPAVGAIYGGQEYINGEGKVIRTFIPKRFSWRRYLYLGDNVPTPTVIFRRSVLGAEGGLDPAYTDAADYDFYLRILGAVRVEPIREPLVRFRYHESSKTGSNIDLQLDEGLEIRLKRARGPVARVSMRALERAKRAILPRVSSWPDPEPRGLNRINAALTGNRRKRSRQA